MMFSFAHGKDHPSRFQSEAEHVKEAFIHAWNSYKENTWGADELAFKEVLKAHKNDWLSGNGMTIIDSMGTLLLMRQTEEFSKALEFVKTINWNKNATVSVFECAVHYIGGLLSAFSLSQSQYPELVQVADSLARRLLPAFASPLGLTYQHINLMTGEVSGTASLSEMGSVALELNYLSFLTSNSTYANAAARAQQAIETAAASSYKIAPRDFDGLIGVDFNQTGLLPSSLVSIGGGGGNYYAGLIKSYIQNRTRSNQMSKFLRAVRTTKTHLLRYSNPSNFSYIVDASRGPNGTFEAVWHRWSLPKCSFSGALALSSVSAPGGKAGTEEDLAGNLDLSEQLVRTCYNMFAHSQYSMVAPDEVEFVPNVTGVDYWVTNPAYPLRADIFEPLFYLWQITQKKIYKEYAWRIFVAINTTCRNTIGFTGLKDVKKTVRSTTGQLVCECSSDHIQRSSLLSKTLKYLYLMFLPDNVISLERYVFSTQGHPLPVFREGDVPPNIPLVPASGKPHADPPGIIIDKDAQTCMAQTDCQSCVKTVMPKRGARCWWVRNDYNASFCAHKCVEHKSCIHSELVCLESFVLPSSTPSHRTDIALDLERAMQTRADHRSNTLQFIGILLFTFLVTLICCCTYKWCKRRRNQQAVQCAFEPVAQTAASDLFGANELYDNDTNSSVSGSDLPDNSDYNDVPIDHIVATEDLKSLHAHLADEAELQVQAAAQVLTQQGGTIRTRANTDSISKSTSVSSEDISLSSDDEL